MEDLFSERLRSCRQQKGLSQRKLAMELEITDSAVNMMEKRKRYPSFEVLIILADYFGVSIDYLVGRTDKPEVNK